MRLFMKTIFLFLSSSILAQSTYKTDIFDTINIRYNDFDSCYYLKDYNLKDWDVYYDSTYSNIAMSVRIKNDTCCFINYYKNGKPKRFLVISNYSTKRKEEQEKWWYENGQLLVAVDYNKFPRNIVNYYSNGNRKMDFITDDYSFIGLYRDWFQNGNLKSHGKYSDNKKNGIWLYFDEGGELNRIEEYKNGKLIKSTENQ